MLSLGRVWTLIIYVVNRLTLSSLDSPVSHYIQHTQQPFGGKTAVPNGKAASISQDFPSFKPPGGRLYYEGSNFTCEYPKMTDWYLCSTINDQECWLRHPDGREFNIYTNYEKYKPVGVTRNYTLTIDDSWWNADGLNLTAAKLFNHQYPGPWIQACWGDTVRVRVINKLTHNGTSIHWHGIRQNLTMHMDGVNGVTQCPIAPGHEFTYVWDASQYGSAWYHSHYTAQYADGLLGPLTIHGPVSAPYDEAKLPTLISDWGHNSAFEALHNFDLRKPSILVNGTGSVTRFNSSVKANLIIPEIYQLHFEAEDISELGRPKRYLLRLINTAFATTFIFSIDHHMLQVVSADFVPIVPYRTNNVLVGIGQRYNVIVEAKPVCSTDGTPPPMDGNFWVRTWVADGCGAKGTPGYEKNGILRYNSNSRSDPTSREWIGFPTTCSDEPYDKLKPKIPWTVGPPKNGNKTSAKAGEHFYVFGPNQVPENKSYPLADFALAAGDVDGNVEEVHPMQINYSDPIFLHLDNYKEDWPKPWMVIPEDFHEDDWIYLLLTGKRGTTFSAHPMHLHGHDFALLQQSSQRFENNSQLDLRTTNPPRRDVVLLPANGFVVIAFKADNPGTWLIHCHIAWHISEGLGIQILERQKAAEMLWPKHSPEIKEAEKVCHEWKKWHGDCKNYWPGYNETSKSYPSCNKTFIFQDDSGV